MSKKCKTKDMNQEILNYFKAFSMGHCGNGSPMLKSVVKNGKRRMIEGWREDRWMQFHSE